MDMEAIVKARVLDYYKNSDSSIQKCIKTIKINTSEVVLEYQGIEKDISIDELEKIKTEEDLARFFYGDVKEEQKEEIKTITEEPVIQEPKEVVSPVETEQLDPSVETLFDIKSMAEMKNKVALDNILKKFAINETTGLIDFNKALNVVAENTLNEVVSSIKNNHSFDVNPINYDSTGKYIGPMLSDGGPVSPNEKILSSFENIRIYLNASRMYPEQVNYTDDDINKIMQKYIEKANNIVNGKQAVVTPIPNEQRLEKTAPVPKVDPNLKKLSMRPEENRSAGFADIFVLSIIVLVYAIIIVNLIMKLS